MTRHDERATEDLEGAIQARAEDMAVKAAEQGLMFNPLILNFARLDAYLETLMNEYGIVDKAKREFCERAARVMDRFEKEFEEVKKKVEEARMAQMLQQGTGITPEQMAKLKSLR